MSKQLKADLMLLMVTFGWGISYYLVDLSLEDMGPFTLNANRFLIAFIVALLLAFPKLKNISKATIKFSFLLGLALVLVYIGATFGQKYTTLSNAGFLCGLTVIFTPILSGIIYKKLPSRKQTLVILMCFIGIALLTLKSDFTINYNNLKGDLLCIMCALVYAGHLLITEKVVTFEDVDVFQIGVLQLGTTGVFNLILSFIFETPHLPSQPQYWGPVLFLSIFCTGVAFIVQVVAQQYTEASHVGIIFSLETVFAGIVAYVLAKEVLSPQSYFGAALMITSIFIMEIDNIRNPS
ncbi:MAG TPA: DMT family transporter [Tissierellia bacterium]|jgi:drug/metabolite transporter (DMT)-like permease|nr:DMT family transporter [Tissierellia bacterium]